MKEGGDITDRDRRRDERDESVWLRATGRDGYRDAAPPARERPAAIRRSERKPRRG